MLSYTKFQINHAFSTQTFSNGSKIGWTAGYHMLVLLTSAITIFFKTCCISCSHTKNFILIKHFLHNHFLMGPMKLVQYWLHTSWETVCGTYTNFFPNLSKNIEEKEKKNKKKTIAKLSVSHASVTSSSWRLWCSKPPHWSHYSAKCSGNKSCQSEYKSFFNLSRDITFDHVVKSSYDFKGKVSQLSQHLA